MESGVFALYQLDEGKLEADPDGFAANTTKNWWKYSGEIVEELVTNPLAVVALYLSVVLTVIVPGFELHAEPASSHAYWLLVVKTKLSLAENDVPLNVVLVGALVPSEVKNDACTRYWCQ